MVRRQCARGSPILHNGLPRRQDRDKPTYPKTAEEGLADFQMGLAGEVLMVAFDLGEMHFVGINAGADFVPNSFRAW